MNSLKIKMLGLMVAIMVMTVGLTAWHNLRTQKTMLLGIADQSSRVLGETIRSSIITNMANGHTAEIENILEKITKEPSIESVRIFDESGRILVSGDTEETGDMVGAADLFAYRSNKVTFEDNDKGKNSFSTFVPIYNSPVCHSCHDRDQAVLGILNVRLSLNALSALRGEGREATLLSSAGMLAVLIITITLFVLIYVDAPIRKLVAAMNQVEQGDFPNAIVTVRNSDEMALLSTKFNFMVNRLKGLIETTVQHEREMAISQEKLVHHDEIRNMNITLEERLKEIEYLNITLEERIEEIEEANYKIADLVSDLEDKNTTLEQAVSRLSALYKMGLAINSTMDLGKLFELLIRKTMDTLKARHGYILLLDKEAWTLKIGAVIGVPEVIDTTRNIPLKRGGVSHWVIDNQQPLLIQNMDDARDFNRVSLLGFTRESVICVPLTAKDEVVGTITMANKLDGTPFSAEDLELLTTIAAQASVAIKNARLYEEQQNTYLNTVQALVSAIEASDAYTRGHSERVTRYSLALARQIGLSADSVKKLEQAAILHDIGKIGVDVALLHKEGKLSPEDIDILHQHPIIGVRILDPIHFLNNVLKIIEQHHERFDGKGYPHGIDGKDQLIEARILAVADTYDAMTSDRPYRKALSHDIALQEIADHAGTQFDPEVADAFFQLCKEGGLPS
ncbi:HD domain-containing phosphohydrolase [Desulfuromonas sp. TF]|uniref:HD domain-containing phosphohydrolase n=1 Tax=Desulfuromonas sp. TF TaxID=1232410 RepID=UPI000412122E|nr:HD domain-containing phosphohydrolase [Desulfuromonas sp. TF]